MAKMKLLPSLLLPLCLTVQARDSASQISTETHSRHRNDSVRTDQTSQLAQQWGLRDEELDRYRSLMQGPLGSYSPNLDPLSALGIEARTDAERQRYALLQVAATITNAMTMVESHRVVSIA